MHATTADHVLNADQMINAGQAIIADRRVRLGAPTGSHEGKGPGYRVMR